MDDPAKAIGGGMVKVKITYLDRGRGVWSVRVPGSPERPSFHNGDAGQWQSVTVTMPRAPLQDAPLLLNYEGGDDTIFHLIEIERI